MNLDLTAILNLAYIIAIGIAFAMVYTNVQRSSYAKFIDALMTEEAFTADTAKSLKELNIKGINKLIIKSSVKNKYTLGKSVSVLPNKSCNDELEAFLSGAGSDMKFYIHDEDHAAILNKYNYKPIKIIHMIVYFLALIFAMFLFTIGIKLFFEKYITPKLESDQQEKVEEQISTFDDINNESDSATPTVPTLN